MIKESKNRRNVNKKQKSTLGQHMRLFRKKYRIIDAGRNGARHGRSLVCVFPLSPLRAARVPKLWTLVGVRFPDDRTFGTCMARRIASAWRGIRRLWTGGNAGNHSCRERSAEAENAQPLVLVESLEAEIERSTVENARRRQKMLYLLVSKACFALGSGAGSVSQIQRIGMLADERREIFLKRFPFYTVKIVFEIFRRFSVSFVTYFPRCVFTRCEYCGAGVPASEMPIGGVHNFSHS